MAMRTLRFALSILAVFIILFLGCQHAAIAYRLRRDGPDPILLPPTVGDHPSESVSIAIKHARETNSTTISTIGSTTGSTTDSTSWSTSRSTSRQTGGPTTGGCDIAGELISLHWQKSTADISFHAQAFFTSESQSPGQVGHGLYVDPLLAIDKFRLDLTERQSKGCLSPVEGERLRRAIVENLPLPPVVAYFLQLGSYNTGFIDLTPDFRLQVTDPIYLRGAETSVTNLLGYETGNYLFLREGRENQMRLRLASATEVPINGTSNHKGGESFEKQTLRNELPFSKSPGYFRLLFMAEEGSSDHITRAVLLSAADENQLSQAVPRRGMSPNDFCTTVSTTNVNCTVFPKNFGVSPELRILVNGKEVFLRVGGMVQEALNLENSEGPPASLKILRPFHGRLIPIKFDRSSGDILKLVLLPGDQLTF